MKLYIYNQDTNEIKVIVNGETNEICEEKADNLNLDQDLYSWSYTDNELIETTETTEI